MGKYVHTDAVGCGVKTNRLTDVLVCACACVFVCVCVVFFHFDERVLYDEC